MTVEQEKYNYDFLNIYWKQGGYYEIPTEIVNTIQGDIEDLVKENAKYKELKEAYKLLSEQYISLSNHCKEKCKEVNQLKHDLDVSLKTTDDLEDIRKKAIEYINEHKENSKRDYSTGEFDNYDLIQGNEVQELLEILEEK